MKIKWAFWRRDDWTVKATAKEPGLPPNEDTGGRKPMNIRGNAVGRSAGERGHYELTPITAFPRVENPFAAPRLPAGMAKPKMAQDDSIQAFFGNGSGDVINFSEGIGFFGYTYLAELAQRAEYRKGFETLAREMTRKWIKFTYNGKKATDSKVQAKEDPETGLISEITPDDGQDKIEELEAEFKKLQVRDAFRRVAELDGAFGRGHIFFDFGTTTDAELMTPLIADPRKIRKGSLKGLTVVEPLWTYPNSYNSTNPLRPDFMVPQSWVVMSKRVHRSRLMTFVGREVPDLLKPAYAFGGLSLSQMAKPYVDNWLRTRQSVSDLIHSFTVWGIKTDLSGTLSGADDGDQMVKRAALFNNVRDNRGVWMLDKGTPNAENAEEFFNVTTPLGTLDHLQAQSQEQMSSVFSIPLVILLGITPSGLNASSDGEIRVFYDFIKAFQEHLFEAPLGVVLKVVQLHLWGKVDENISFEFVPLWQLDEAAEAGVFKTMVDAGSEAIANGSISPEEERRRLASDRSGPYGFIDPDDVPEPPMPPGIDPLTGLPLEPPEGGEEEEGPPKPGAAPAKPGVPAAPAAPATKPPKLLPDASKGGVGKSGV